ncbi:hypothetical protein VPH219E481_0071 [Vibrio phage 219E48-1]|nr:hypothetical protein PODOV021v1_p0059 [Vibrio phage 219E41.2]
MSCVYVAESGCGYVKIGMSQEPLLRHQAIARSTGLNITRFEYKEMLGDAFMAEQEIHKKLASNRLFGEWFAIDFDEALGAVVKQSSIELKRKSRLRIAPFYPTVAQREWLDNQVKETGNGQAAILRSLLQEQVNKKKKQGK